MLQRTWAYGTRRPAELQDITRLSDGRAVLVAIDGEHEGHVIVVGNADAAGLRSGMRGQVVFTKGGRTGGYWRFEPDGQPGGGEGSNAGGA